jgi:transketolase
VIELEIRAVRTVYRVFWMKEIAFRDALAESLVQLGEEDERVVVLDADLSKSTRSVKFAERFPERFFNVGISEQDLVCTAAGLALSGFVPVACTFAMFGLGRAWEQVRNSIARPNLNAKLCFTHAGVSDNGDGASHQIFEDIAIARTIPNLRVLVPADGLEAKKAVACAVREEGPFYVRLGRNEAPIVTGIDEDWLEFGLGKMKALREGSDCTIVACGIMVDKALKAAGILEKRGVNCEVLNASSIKPFDSRALVSSARKTGCVVTAEEHSTKGGLGGVVSEVLCSEFPVPVEMVGVGERYGTSADKAEDVLQFLELTPEAIENAVESAVKRNGR